MSMMMKYFVLKPKGKDAFAAASRAAMLRYSDMIKAHDPQLAEQLYQWATTEAAEAHPGMAGESARQMR